MSSRNFNTDTDSEDEDKSENEEEANEGEVPVLTDSECEEELLVFGTQLPVPAC